METTPVATRIARQAVTILLVTAAMKAGALE
jgi:hypothetical protein